MFGCPLSPKCSAHKLKISLALGTEYAIYGHMYIRAKAKKNKGSSKIYYTHELVESRRTEKGPRQITLLNLDPFDLHHDYWKMLANRIQEVISGQQRLMPLDEHMETLARHYAKLLIQKQFKENSEHQEHEADFQSVDVNAIASTEAKSIGPEYLGLEAMKQLDFFQIFKKLEFTRYAMDLAALLIVGRLVHPSSENELRRYVHQESGLEDLLQTNLAHLPKNALYETSDLLWRHKESIESFLRQHCKKMLGLGESIILYDLTNTYFEGDAHFYDKARRGKSKDKRNDRPLVTLGAVLDEQGFLKTSRIYEGNISESKTLLDMIRAVHTQAREQQPPLPVEKPTVVMDAGLATEDNLSTLKEYGFSYIVVSRSRPQNIPESQFVELKKGIKVQSFIQEQELFLYCQSEAKAGKENSMLNKAKEKMEQELVRLRQGLGQKRKLKRYDKVLERIGRLRKQYSRVSAGFDIQVHAKNHNAVNITWSFNVHKLRKPYNGSYFLRTDRTDLDNERIWSLYIMLTTVEDAFRNLKDELGLRPNFHQKPERIEGHIFITVLAYHLLHYIRYRLNQAGLYHRWETVRAWLKTHRIQTSSLPREQGGAIHIRHCTTPTFEQQDVYSALGISNVPVKPKKVVNQQK